MKELLENIAGMVRRKVQELPDEFTGDEEVSIGASGSATSKIDKFAEDAIFDFMRRNNVDLNILSEEAGLIDNGSEMTLVIDPLDGTANYHARIPFYSISLAIGKERLGDITHGLVMNLLSGDTYYAEKGVGATHNGTEIMTREFNRPGALFLAYVGNSTNPETWRIMEKPRRVRSLGCASLEMCYVAHGRADGFYFNCDDFSKRMRIIDIAASALILREAGGELFDLKGNQLDMKFSLDDRANFMALGDRKIKEMMM
ncbi:MAG: D-fructose 1,6-bisphosphatase [Thermoplasmata archaeon]|nr:D-fructose 1,6-bisphosphatase [Thermoplasmata archaeon]